MSALTDVFTAIATAIRNKKGVLTEYTPSEMPAAIESIKGGIGFDTNRFIEKTVEKGEEFFVTLSPGEGMITWMNDYEKGGYLTISGDPSRPFKNITSDPKIEVRYNAGSENCVIQFMNDLKEEGITYKYVKFLCYAC